MASGFIDLVGTPMLLSTGTNNLTIGCNGAGILRLYSGGIMAMPVSAPAEGTAAAGLLTAGTVTVTNAWHRVITAGAVTGVILSAGTVHGQMLRLTVDKDASGSVTFAAAGTSRVSLGATCVLAAGESRDFIWDNTDLIWSVLGAK